MKKSPIGNPNPNRTNETKERDTHIVQKWTTRTLAVSPARHFSGEAVAAAGEQGGGAGELSRESGHGREGDKNGEEWVEMWPPGGVLRLQTNGR